MSFGFANCSRKSWGATSMGAKILFRSWAMPLARRPIPSSRWAWRSWSSSDLALGHIALDRDVVDDLAVGVAKRLDIPIDVELGAVFPVIDVFADKGVAGFEVGAEAIQCRARCLRTLQETRALSDDLVGPPTGHAGESGIDVDNMRTGFIQNRVCDDDRFAKLRERLLSESQRVVRRQVQRNLRAAYVERCQAFIAVYLIQLRPDSRRPCF